MNKQMDEQMNEVPPYSVRSHHIYSKSGSAAIKLVSGEQTCLDLFPAVTCIVHPEGHGNSDMILSGPHTPPQRARQRVPHLGGQTEGKPRPGQAEAVVRVTQALLLIRANMFVQQGPMALGRVFHFQHSGPGSYHKYFLQLTFLATLKLFQRVT